ncbi:sugar transferase, partial [bacterium]|nr:sugar transferase [bacterium]
YLQKRLGLNGQAYIMVKLRTMVHDAESGTGAVWASSADPRVTRLGSFLRKTQIDEFPQLWNVLMGEMSLIGPRPERPEIAQRLELDIPHYMQRLHVKPGITGLAQLTLPADTDLESVRRKLIPDLYYVKHMSLMLDMKIFAHTGLYFVRSILRCVHQVFALPTLNSARLSLTAEFEDGFEEVEAKAS